MISQTETNKIDIPRSLYNSMKRAIKPDVPPGEFKCRRCEVTWSSFMKDNIPCTTTAKRNGLHDFDFATPIVVQLK